jgi:hypothetical protein
MLVYEKMKKKPIKEVILPAKRVSDDAEMKSESRSALGCADTAISRDIQTTASVDTS